VDKKIAEKIAHAGSQLGVVAEVKENYQPGDAPYNTRTTGVRVVSWPHFAACAAQAVLWCDSEDAKYSFINEVMNCKSDNSKYGLFIY
jgi:hypothetical protein